MKAPAETKTTAEIVVAAEKEDVSGGLRSDPNVSSVEYRSSDVTAFVAWYNPYSGRAACHAYIYVLDETKGVWVRKLAKRYDGTPTLSVEFGRVITIRDYAGKAVQSYPKKIPAEQGGARQPATAVDSKSEGNEKPKPKSEGRSR